MYSICDGCDGPAACTDEDREEIGKRPANHVEDLTAKQ